MGGFEIDGTAHLPARHERDIVLAADRAGPPYLSSSRLTTPRRVALGKSGPRRGGEETRRPTGINWPTYEAHHLRQL